jgi:hypothetical protein
MRWLWDIAGYLSDLAAVRPWTSWLMHAIIAVPIAWAFGPTAAFAVFGFREAEQILHRKINGQALEPLDHFMDVFAPALAAGLTGMLFS